MLRCQILRFIFQSTLPREERQWMMRHGKRFTTFQSTLPREERLFEVKNLGKVLLFQSTLPREERHRGNRRRSDCYNFNPRSHERSDEVEAKRKAKLEISIHAPTRGATEAVTKLWSHIKISIHAPTRGATRPCRRWL